MRNIDGNTRLCGLIGNPVAHSVSPAIHNTLAELLNDNIVYSTFCVEPNRVDQAVKGAYALGVLGLNVTVPYKSDVIPYLVEMDPLAKRIGASNTLVRVDGGFKGYNTDMQGLYRAMREDGVDIADEHILIIGAGGVARAVAMMSATYCAASITILNRTLDKAQKIKEELETLFPNVKISVFTLQDFNRLPENDYVAIQATNVGMHPNTDEVVIDNAEFYDKIKTAYDLIFNPLTTKFMRLAESAGIRSYNGLKMLLYQGIIAYELWNECKVPDDAIQKAYQKMKEAMGINE